MTDDLKPDRTYALQPTHEDEEPVQVGYQIGSLAEMEWAMGRLSALKAQLAENDALAAQAIERFQRHVDSLKRAPLAQAEFLENAILAYAQDHRAELLKGGKKKSRELPSGTVGWRKTGGRLQVVNEDEALAWAKSQPLEAGLYRVKVEISKSGFQEHFKATGEVPAGCVVEDEGETCYVKPAELVLSLGELPKRLTSGEPEKP